MTDLSEIVEPMKSGAEALSFASVGEIVFVHGINALLHGERLGRAARFASPTELNAVRRRPPALCGRASLLDGFGNAS